MFSVPLPFIVGLAVILTLQRSLKGADAPGSRRYFAAFLVLYAMQAIIVGLRFGYGVQILETVQPITASALSPVAFLAFRALAEPAPERVWRHAIGPVLVAIAQLQFRDLVDPLLLALFSVYGVMLLRLTFAPGGEMVVAPFQQAGPVTRAARLTACLMLFFAVSDAVLALYTYRYGNADVPLAVSLMNLAVIAGLLAYYALESTLVSVPVAQKVERVSAEDRLALERITHALDEQDLYKDENLSLSKLARKAALPARDVSGVVNRATGINVSQFVNARRITEACRLLRQTKAPLTQVMFDSGFSTKSNFNREFRRITGMSPKQWRARVPGNSGVQPENKQQLGKA